MKYASRAVKWLKSLSLVYVGAAVLIIVALFFFLRPSTTETKTLLLAEKPFLQEVSVSGKVVAAQEVDLGFSQGGRVTAVYARVGARVSAGATLAVIENSDLQAALLQREAALENQKARLASIQAGTRPEEIAIAQSSVDRDSRALIDAIGDAYRSADAAVHNTLDQFISNPRTSPVINFQVSDSSLKSGTESKRLAAEALLATWGSEAAALSVSSDLAGAAAKAQTNLTAIVSLLSDANAVINRGIATTQTPQSTLDAYSAAVATARTSVNASVASVTSASSALDASRKNLTLKQAGSTPQDIAAQQAQVKAAEADVAAARAQLQKTVISAPFSGVVTTVDAKIGKIVSPNTPEISMISAGAYQIESYVPEINIALISVGDSAQITLDAYGDTKFGASVVSLDPAETLRDGVSTYRAILQFNDADDRIKSGMTATVAILTDEKPSALSVPQGIVRYRDGKPYLLVVAGEQTTERAVTLGSVSSLGEIEILSGVSAGETVVADLP